MLAQSENRTGAGRSLVGDWPLAGCGAGFWVGITELHTTHYTSKALAQNLAAARQNCGGNVAGSAKPRVFGGKARWRVTRRKRDEVVNRQR
jgi:hypothetical protein